MPQLIQQYVSRQGVQRPKHTAIVWKNETIPYGEFDKITNQIAHQLRSCGCRNGDRVGVLIPASANAIFAMLGILKADCVYVPIDPESSAAATAHIFESVEPKVVLAARSAKALLNEIFAEHELSEKIQIGTLEAIAFGSENFETSFTGINVLRASTEQRFYERKPTDPAVIHFQSQEADEINGVVTSHANIIYSVEWAQKYFQIDERDCVSGHASSGTDFSAFDTLGTFAAGAELHLIPSDFNRHPQLLCEFIRSHDVTQWVAKPSILNSLVKHDAVNRGDFPSLKRLMWTGEELPTSTISHLMQRLPLVQFTKLYGSTETTIASSYFTVPSGLKDDLGQIPIGRPCEGVGLFVLDADLQPLALDEIGELYIGGVGLSSGYWRDPKRTNAAFVQHPILRQRLFRTGDLARIGFDGFIYLEDRLATQEAFEDWSLDRRPIIDHDFLEACLTNA